MSDAPSAHCGPVERLRGIDPRLFDERGNHALVLVRASCDAVAAALARHAAVHPEISDIFAAPVTIAHKDFARALFVYQLRGHHWTQIDGYDVCLWSLAEWLSKELGAAAFQYIFQDVTGGYGYSVYERGELTESFNDVDLSGFGDEAVEGNRQQATANGYQVSSSGRLTFLTKRGTTLDLNSPAGPAAILARVANELGLYVAVDVFNTSKTGIVECVKPWQISDFQAAKVLIALSEEKEYQRRFVADGADEEERLVLESDPEAFERMQKMLTGEVEAVIPAEFEDIFRECDELARKLREGGGERLS